MLSNKALCERFINGAMMGDNTNMHIDADMWTGGDITWLRSYGTVIATSYAGYRIEFNPAQYSPSTTRQQQALYWALIDAGYVPDKEWTHNRPKLKPCQYPKEQITFMKP